LPKPKSSDDSKATKFISYELESFFKAKHSLAQLDGRTAADIQSENSPEKAMRALLLLHKERSLTSGLPQRAKAQAEAAQRKQVKSNILSALQTI
jgi:hypothetical protein